MIVAEVDVFRSFSKSLTLTLVMLVTAWGQTGDHEWTDATGNYKFTAELVVVNEKKAILQKHDGQLIAIDLDQLSEADRKYINSQRANKITPANTAAASKTWSLRDGFKVEGDIVDFVDREMTIRRYVGKIYVDEHKLDDLPKAYRKLIPAIASHIEQEVIEDEQQLMKWVKKQPYGKAVFQCKGVQIELDNGDRYALPLFLFEEADSAILQSGWHRWRQAQQQKQREDELLLLRAQSAARSARSRESSVDQSKRNTQQMLAIAELSMQLEAYDAGLFDLWEVQLLPPVGTSAMWQSVIVPGRNSDQAAKAALASYPDYRVGAIVKLRRRQ